MTDYDLDPITTLIGKVRPTAHSESGTVRLLTLNALFVYFQYAVASVRMQEANILAMAGGQHKSFPTHDEYADCLLKLYSSAINAYSNLRTCLHFSRALIDEVPQGSPGVTQLKAYRETHSKWAKDVIDRRDRIAAHPAQRDALVWKPNMWCDDGRVGFVVRNVGEPTRSRNILLHPRSDLEKLRSYLAGLAPLLEQNLSVR